MYIMCKRTLKGTSATSANPKDRNAHSRMLYRFFSRKHQWDSSADPATTDPATDKQLFFGSLSFGFLSTVFYQVLIRFKTGWPVGTWPNNFESF